MPVVLTVLTVITVMAVAMAVSACGSTPTAPSSRPPATTVPAKSAAPGLVPADPHLTDRIELATASVHAGTPVDAVPVVTNHVSTPIDLTTRCWSQFAAVLARGATVYGVAFAAACSSEPFTIVPGVNKLAGTVLDRHRSAHPNRLSSSISWRSRP